MKISHLTHFTWTAASSPLSNLAVFLQTHGHSNILYRRKHTLPHAEAIEKSENRKWFYDIFEHSSDGNLNAAAELGARLLRRSETDRIGRAFATEHANQIHGDFYIGYDGAGASMAYEFNAITRKPYLIFSLELEENPYISRRDRLAWSGAVAVLTFDESRADILRRQYSISQQRIGTVPNSSIGEIRRERSIYLRQKFNIAHSMKIVLAVGTLCEFTRIRELICSVKEWPKDYLLILHGWGLTIDDENLIDQENTANGSRIIVSREMLSREQRWEIFCSADIGVVAFTDQLLNYRYVGRSAGKLFDFCQCGVPILCNNLPGMHGLVNDTGIGVVVDQFANAGEALLDLSQNHEFYRDACYRFFLANEFASCMETTLLDLQLDYLLGLPRRQNTSSFG